MALDEIMTARALVAVSTNSAGRWICHHDISKKNIYLDGFLGISFHYSVL
jgi:hypothetical protein